MARNSTTKQLTDGILGQHLALSVAAHLARSQLVPDPLDVYDGSHLTEVVNLIGNALAKVAPLYVRDQKTGMARELTPLELEGATVGRAATVLTLKDGRVLSSVSVKRAELRQAIAILKALGIPNLHVPPPKETPAPKPGRPPLLAHLAELESLLRLPLIPSYVEKVEALALGIARQARSGRVANLAMRLLSAIHEARQEGEGDNRRVGLAMARLRAALEEQEKTS
jgi:hypothetical protein